MSDDKSANTSEFKAFVQRGAGEPAPAPNRMPLIIAAVAAALIVLAVLIYLGVR